jgi:hypothetical protein
MRRLDVVELAPRLPRIVAQIADHHAHAHPVEERDQREAQHATHAVEGIVAPLVMDGGGGLVGLEGMAETDLPQEFEHRLVGQEEVMIVVFEGPIPG